MRIGIDAHIVGKKQGGVERYVNELVSRVPMLLPEHDFYLFMTKAYAQRKKNTGNIRYIPLPFSDPLIQRSVILPLLVKRYRIDLLHTQRVIPFFVNCRCIVSIHDILPLNHPGDHPGLRNDIIRKLTPWSARRATAVLTVSDTVKKEIVAGLNIPGGKVYTIYNGIDHAKEGSEKNGVCTLSVPYIFYSGAIEPRKNLLTLITALKLISKRHPNMTLVIAGMDRDPAYRLKADLLVEREGLGSRVKFTGYVSESILERLYRDAELFIAPSMGEGFDLPPLEAMRRGVPVICSDIDVHREVLKDAALFFRREDPEDLSDKMLLLMNNSDLKDGLIRRGLETAELYTWDSTACQTAKIYKEAGNIRQ